LKLLRRKHCKPVDELVCIFTICCWIVVVAESPKPRFCYVKVWVFPVL
jgi:hypothetical protein